MGNVSYFYKAYGLTIASSIPLPPLQPIAPAPADVQIWQESLLNTPDGEPTKIFRAGIQAAFAQTEPGQDWLLWKPLVHFKAIQGQSLIVDTTSTDEDAIALFTMSEAIGLLLFQRGYFLLHGSAIRLQNKGIVFLGEPGAGKSTTVAAFAQRHRQVISDDLVCIRLNEAGEPMLVPAFPQIKIWGKAIAGLQIPQADLTPVREGVDKFSWHDTAHFDAQEVPLQRIYVLTKPDSEHSGATPIPAFQAPIELVSYFPLADAMLQGQALKAYFEKSVAIAQTVPMQKMSRPADFEKLYQFVDSLISNLT